MIRFTIAERPSPITFTLSGPNQTESITIIAPTNGPVSQDVIVVGPPGPPGPTGPAGGAYLEYSPPSAQDTWVIPHNLEAYPSVTIVDSFGNEVYANTQHLDKNTLSISFLVPFSGTASLSA